MWTDLQMAWTLKVELNMMLKLHDDPVYMTTDIHI